MERIMNEFFVYIPKKKKKSVLRVIYLFPKYFYTLRTKHFFLRNEFLIIVR